MAIDSAPIIAHRFRKAREQAGLSLGQAARRLGRQRVDIAAIERAEQRISGDEVAVFAELYGVSLHWLTGTEAMQPAELEAQLRLAPRAGESVAKQELDGLLQFLHSVRS